MIFHTNRHHFLGLAFAALVATGFAGGGARAQQQQPPQPQPPQQQQQQPPATAPSQQPTQAQPQSDADAKEQQVHDADEKELFAYSLTMDKIHQLADAQKDLNTLEKSDPDMANNLKSEQGAASLDQITEKLEKYPKLVDVLKKDGLSPREYVVTVIVLIQAGAVVDMKRNGTIKDYPSEVLQLVKLENLTLVEDHYDEIAKAMPSDAGDGKDQPPPPADGGNSSDKKNN